MSSEASYQVEIGTVLIAINPCHMEYDAKQAKTIKSLVSDKSVFKALIVGKEYTVDSIDSECFYVESELYTKHGFYFENIDVFFKPKTSTTNSVDHPTHYGGEGNPYEAIKVIEEWDLDFHLGNALKYIARAGKKSKDTELQDLEKAQWYINRKIEQLKKVQ
jgi:hypothetical protein